MSLLTARTTEPIPGYRVLERIGAGGYGEVWTAQAPGDLKKAIKFVYGLLDEDRAVRELKALNRIKGVRHPFLLSLERIEIVEGQLLIVTELADCSLKDRFEECRKKNLPGIPRDELLFYLRDAADALDYMSEQHSLQHLDVKPENLLLLSGRVKVADFGLVKDIHDHTASMMGGLTPVYAPPEVFEGRPTRRSDQYSLAIVYQEMLTGVLPFPGRTAAQLAAQHLNAKPRLGALSPSDQEVVARALAKKPTDRFAQCRELIDALANIGKQPAAASQSAAGVSPQSAAELGAMQTQGVTAVRSAAAQAATSALGSRTAASMLHDLEQASQAVADAVDGSNASTGDEDGGFRPPSLANLGPAPAVVDQPPVEIDATNWQPRPTLFVGLGGLGSRVLGRLRRRLDDRLDASARQLFPMLAFDSDSRDLATARHASGDRLRPEELHALALRRSQDYRTDSRKILNWLSRRWLFNIPRSQQTEGLRPLGRLALVDHSEQALGHLRAGVQSFQQALADNPASSKVKPRVVIIAAIGGGTGGGMLTDICFAARQILDEQEMPEAEVLAMLAHGTNRNPQQQELAAVNAVATLTELEQFHRSPFPGDPSCGLNDRQTGALAAAYLVHLGEELAPEQFDAACDRVAEFLLLNSASPASVALEECRESLAEGSSALALRTFGLVQIGFGHDSVVDQAVKRASRGVIERWIGEPRREEAPKNVRLLPGPDAPPASPPPAISPQAVMESRAAAIVERLHLEIDPLMQQVQQLAAEEMGGNPEGFFLSLAPLDGSAGTSQIQRWFEAANGVFGCPADEAGAKAQPSRLLLSIEARVTKLIQQVGGELRQGVESLVDDPALRVHGAQRVAKLIQTHLKSLGDRLREARTRLQHETQATIHHVWAALADPKGKGKGKQHTPQQIQALFLQVCRLRLFELCAQVAGKIGHALQSHAGGSYDGLCDLARDLHHLAVELARDELQEEEESSGSDQLAPLRTLVAQQLRSSDDRLAAELDQQLSATKLAAKGGLKAAILAGGHEREALVDELQAGARQAVLKRLAAIDIAGQTLTGEGEDHPLRQLVAHAQPWFQPCGGERRLICVVPTAAAETLTPAALAMRLGPNEFKQLPSVVADAAQDVVLLFEMGGLSLRHAAAVIVGLRPDLVELSSRLHTRSDITWTPLLS